VHAGVHPGISHRRRDRGQGQSHRGAFHRHGGGERGRRGRVAGGERRRPRMVTLSQPATHGQVFIGRPPARQQRFAQRVGGEAGPADRGYTSQGGPPGRAFAAGQRRGYREPQQTVVRGRGQRLQTGVGRPAGDDPGAAHQLAIDPVDVSRRLAQPIPHHCSVSDPVRTACGTAAAA
jgi:hypothetical protein